MVFECSSGTRGGFREDTCKNLAVKGFAIIFAYPKAVMPRKPKFILPFLFAWILLFGFSGLACGLHLCHSGERANVDVEQTAHDHHEGEEGCCDSVAELLQSTRDFGPTPGTWQNVALLPELPSFDLRVVFPNAGELPVLHYKPPSLERDIHILHEVFIL